MKYPTRVSNYKCNTFSNSFTDWTDEEI